MRKVRQLLLRTFTDEVVHADVAAEFWVQGGKVIADYKLDSVRAMIEDEGISGFDGAILFPSDGTAFIERLPLAMARSTVFGIRDVEREDTPTKYPSHGTLDGKRIALKDAAELSEWERARIEVTLPNGEKVRPFRLVGDGADITVEDGVVTI